MGEPNTWIDVFNATTWRQFLDAGAEVSGFPERRWNTVQQIRPGDRLYCYVAGISRWVGVLEVTGDPYNDSTTIWGEGEYPARLPVRVLEKLTLETGVPALDLRNEMHLFQSLKNPNKWSIYFRSSPGRLEPDDARILDAAIADARMNPKSRPVPKSASRPRPRVLEAPEGVVTVPDDDAQESNGNEEVTASAHTEMQWLLLRLGSSMGLSVWVARNDRSRSWKGDAFASLSRLLTTLPHQFDPATMTTIELIDVLWLDGNAIVAAFEIESTTSIYSGLLRMADLLAMQPNLNIPLFLVAPEARRPKVFREVNRPTFARLATPLADVCRYVSFEDLRDYMSRAADYLKYLKPDFLQEVSESCAIEDA